MKKKILYTKRKKERKKNKSKSKSKRKSNSLKKITFKYKLINGEFL